MMGLNISSTDPAIGALLQLLAGNPKEAKQLLQQLQQAADRHHAEFAAAQNEKRDVAVLAGDASRLLAQAQARDEELTLRERAVSERERAVAAREDSIAAIKKELGL
jgi:putative NIF3 family GTP cyclohydrolase 1 type 2